MGVLSANACLETNQCDKGECSKRPLCPVREKEQGDSFPQQYWSGLGPKEPASELERVVNKNIRLSGRFLPKGWGNGLHKPLGIPGFPHSQSSPFPVCVLPGSRCCCLLQHMSHCADVLGLNQNQIALVRLQANSAICQTQKCPLV